MSIYLYDLLFSRIPWSALHGFSVEGEGEDGVAYAPLSSGSHHTGAVRKEEVMEYVLERVFSDDCPHRNMQTGTTQRMREGVFWEGFPPKLNK